MYLEDGDSITHLLVYITESNTHWLGWLNDMWRYNIATNTWTYLCGNQKKSSLSNYISPQPGGIYDHTMVISNTNLYVFGGFGLDATSPGTIFILYNSRSFK